MAKLNYTVRATLAPGETVESLIPVLVDRRQPTDLSAVIENAIDRSLIAGLKPSAAEGIADGIARQLAHEFAKGRSVGFGHYFYGRPYLSGTVDANGRLTAANGINVRLYKGEDFKLTLDDFSFSYEEGGSLPKVDFVLSSPGNLRGEVVTGGEVTLNGRMLHLDGDANTVVFQEEGAEGAPVVVDTFTAAGPDILSFDCPAALVAGKRYAVTATRTDENGVTRTSNTRTVTVKAGETPPGPTPTEPTFTKVTEQGHEDDAEWVNKVGRDGRVSIVGTNLTADLVAKFTADGNEETFNVAEVTDTLIKGQIAGGLEYPCDLTFSLEKPDGDVVGATSVEVVDE